DLAFWRDRLDRFRSPKAFALVVDTLLRKGDYRAALALLINWVGQAEQVPLEDGPYSFHTLALRWMLALTRPVAPGEGGQQEAAAGAGHRSPCQAAVPSWFAGAHDKQQRLLGLLDAIHGHPLPEPSGDYESLVEYDRRRVLKEQLLYTAIGTCLDMSLAVGAL